MVAARAEQARAPSTWQAYRKDWGYFECWCEQIGATAKPASPMTVAAYVAWLSDPDGRGPYAASTVGRRMAAITAAHEADGLADPCADPLVRGVRSGVRRKVGVAPRQRKRGVSTDDLRAACRSMGDRLIDVRDRAILLVGYAGAFRRSELVGLDVDDSEEVPEGLVLTVRRSKRDQEGKGRKVAVCYGTDPVTCPVRAWRTWLARSEVTSGPVFRPVRKGGQVTDRRLSPHAVGQVVKRHMGPLGHDTADFAGHSLRRGMATTAARNGAADRTIIATTGHASSATLAPYVEEGRRFEDPASGYLGL